MKNLTTQQDFQTYSQQQEASYLTSTLTDSEKPVYTIFFNGKLHTINDKVQTYTRKYDAVIARSKLTK